MLLFLFDNTLPKIYEIAKPIINITIPIRTSLKQEIDNIAFLIIIIIEIISSDLIIDGKHFILLKRYDTSLIVTKPKITKDKV